MLESIYHFSGEWELSEFSGWDYSIDAADPPYTDLQEGAGGAGR